MAKRQGLQNFSMLASHVLVPPAIRALLTSSEHRVQGFIAPGHVCTIMDCEEYESSGSRLYGAHRGCGFEPVDILQAVLMLVKQLESGSARLENQYVRSVSYQGNPLARQAMQEVFEVADQKWRGMGMIAGSGCVCVKNTPPMTRTRSST